MILLLLVSFKGFSQKDIQSDSSYVILTEQQARAVTKDLVRYDFQKQIVIQQDSRIKTLLVKDATYKDLLTNKDSIINLKDREIEIQGEMLNRKQPVAIHSYVGAKLVGISLTEPVFYNRTYIQLWGFNAGAYGEVRVNATESLGWGVFIEYKIF